MAAARLQMILRSTTDPALRDSLSTVLPDSTMHNEYGLPAPFSDRAALTVGAYATAAPLRQTDREVPARWDGELADSLEPFAPPLPRVAREMLAEGDAAAQLLATGARQARALQLVVDAHRLGAASLPEDVLRAVQDALLARPIPLQGLARA